ncbi:hypothetical protein H0H93_011586 [Arthromyces matolae]|nr:hypothetical protein H0H93_011586 [Arthromyces matolae]
MDPPNLSFIGIVDFSEKAKWLYMTPSVYDLLGMMNYHPISDLDLSSALCTGYEPPELVGRPSLELVHPDELEKVRRIHQTVVHNVLVGSVSFANPAKALHNASTAQEVEVVSPTSSTFQTRRWHDPSVSPVRTRTKLPTLSPATSWNSRRGSTSTSESDSDESTPIPELQKQDSFQYKDEAFHFDHLPNQSLRTFFILNRFTERGTIMYCSNDCLVTTLNAMGRPFFDFVHESDEETVKKWIETVKGWGVNDLGQPSDGGCGYGCFKLLARGLNASPTQSIQLDEDLADIDPRGTLVTVTQDVLPG